MLLGSAIPAMLDQPWNAELPMLVTPLGIITLVTVSLKKNAESPMLVTGRPLVEMGMVTAPPGPVYPVMVIAPLFVTKMNWACTTTGSVNTNTIVSKHLAQAVLIWIRFFTAFRFGKTLSLVADFDTKLFERQAGNDRISKLGGTRSTASSNYEGNDGDTVERVPSDSKALSLRCSFFFRVFRMVRG